MHAKWMLNYTLTQHLKVWLEVDTSVTECTLRKFTKCMNAPSSCKVQVLTENISVMLFSAHDTILNVTSTPAASTLIGPRRWILYMK